MLTRKHGGGKKFGVRHLQLIFAFFHAVIDGIGHNGVLTYYSRITVGDFKGSLNEERLFSRRELVLMEGAGFLMASFARLSSPFMVVTLNNKYLSIGVTFIEVFLYCSVVYVYSILKFAGVVSLFAVLSYAQSMRLPLALNTVSKWIPPREHTRALVVVTCGTQIGRGIGLFLNNIPNIGKVLFFVLGALKLAHAVAYFFFGAQDPQTCWILKRAEWNFLCREISYRRKIHCPCRPPWRNFIRTPMIYGLMCSGIASKWFFVDYLHFKEYIPGYENAVNISILLYPILQFAAAWGVDVMIYKEIVTRNNIRKICSCFVCWGSSIAICFMCFYSRDPGKVVGYFIIACYCAFGYVISENATVFDMSPNYAVEIQAIYSFPAWVVAALKSIFLDPEFPLKGKEPFRENLFNWYCTAFVMFVMNYGFLMFGDISWCQFDTFNAVDWRKESQLSYP